MDMTQDVFADCSFGQMALQKLAPTHPDFRLYKAGWLGDDPHNQDVMEVSGGVFRKALSGPNKGKLTVLLPHTSRKVYVTAGEIDEIEATAAAAN